MPRKKDDNLDLLLTLLMRIVSPLKSIPVQTADAMNFIRPENVAFMTTNDKYIDIYDLDGNKWTRFDNLTSMEKKLEKDPRFFRSHRSYLINTYAVKSLFKDDRGKVWKVSFAGAIQETANVSTDNLQTFKQLMELE
jgi:DNA-binding LytR/AlgR family response regulator